jgi:hypothetical protein
VEDAAAKAWVLCVILLLMRTRGWPANTCVQGSRGVKMEPSQPQGNILSHDAPHSQSYSGISILQWSRCSASMTPKAEFDLKRGRQRSAHGVSSVA